MEINLTSDVARALRAAEVEMLMDLHPNWLITFNFGFRVHPDKARKLASWWFNAAQRVLYGPSWATQLDRQWPAVHGYLEHPDSNPHFHCLAAIPKRMGYWAEGNGDELWRKVANRGQLDVREINNVYKTARYCTKDYIRRQGLLEKFIYKDTRPATIGESQLRPGKES